VSSAHDGPTAGPRSLADRRPEGAKSGARAASDPHSHQPERLHSLPSNNIAIAPPTETPRVAPTTRHTPMATLPANEAPLEGDDVEIIAAVVSAQTPFISVCEHRQPCACRRNMHSPPTAEASALYGQVPDKGLQNTTRTDPLPPQAPPPLTAAATGASCVPTRPCKTHTTCPPACRSRISCILGSSVHTPCW